MMVERVETEDTLNREIRKYLKRVGITSQGEIERAVREAREAGRLKGGEVLAVEMTLAVPALKLRVVIDGSVGVGE
jgi:hypothetical protein